MKKKTKPFPLLEISFDEEADTATAWFLPESIDEPTYGVNIDDVFILHLGEQSNKLLGIEIIGFSKLDVNVDMTFHVFQILAETKADNEDKWEEVFRRSIEEYELIGAQ